MDGLFGKSRLVACEPQRYPAKNSKENIGEKIRLTSPAEPARQTLEPVLGRVGLGFRKDTILPHRRFIRQMLIFVALP